MEIKNLDWPRLSGELWYAIPPFWMFIEDENEVKILPAPTPRGLMVFLIALGVIVIVGVQIARPFVHDRSDQILMTIGSVCVALAEIVGAIFLKVTFEREQARGPILFVSSAKREVSLPRESKTWSFDQIVRWDIVYGCRIRDRFWGSRGFDSFISELQVVVANGENGLSAWPIAGAFTANDPPMHNAALSAAQRTNTPLFLVTAKESRLLWSPPNKRELPPSGGPTG